MMTVAEEIEGQIARLLDGRKWYKGLPIRRGACAIYYNNTGFPRDYFHLTEETIEFLNSWADANFKEPYGINSIVSYNDLPRTTLWQVIDILADAWDEALELRI